MKLLIVLMFCLIMFGVFLDMFYRKIKKKKEEFFFNQDFFETLEKKFLEDLKKDIKEKYECFDDIPFYIFAEMRTNFFELASQCKIHWQHVDESSLDIFYSELKSEMKNNIIKKEKLC